MKLIHIASTFLAHFVQANDYAQCQSQLLDLKNEAFIKESTTLINNCKTQYNAINSRVSTTEFNIAQLEEKVAELQAENSSKNDLKLKTFKEPSEYEIDGWVKVDSDTSEILYFKHLPEQNYDFTDALKACYEQFGRPAQLAQILNRQELDAALKMTNKKPTRLAGLNVKKTKKTVDNWIWVTSSLPVKGSFFHAPHQGTDHDTAQNTIILWETTSSTNLMDKIPETNLGALCEIRALKPGL